LLRNLTGDFDVEGKADLAAFRPPSGIWYLLRPAQIFTGVRFGTTGDLPFLNSYIG
jgi:hypothetical protein